jgi:LacI family transcriptional regulator
MKLKDLARLLDLSTTTVSRALNGYPEVNAATRTRVLEAARQHGYSPNLVARRLATGRAMAIGYVVPLAPHQLINPIFADFIHGAGETYSAAGYDMVLSVVPEDREAEAYAAMARHRKVDGVMVHSALRRDPRIDILDELGLTYLSHGRNDLPEDSYSWLDINNRRAFLLATEYLLDLGHRRIALINGPEDQNFAWRRRLGYEAALTGRGIALDPALMRAGDMVETHGDTAVIEMMAQPDPPTAFLVSAMTIALGALRAVRELGLAPGRDISIVTHDDRLSFLPNGGGNGTAPLFTATRSSIRAAGRRSAEMLIERINDPGGTHRSELWEVDLTPGLSTGPNPKGPRDA